jgi:DNA-directed RNA polymerase specialized sigma subunit
VKSLELSQVKKDNSNIRGYSDTLWRELRKERFKPANPDLFTNQMAAEQHSLNNRSDVDFIHDINKFIDLKLKPREAAILRLFLFGGGLTQWEIAEEIGTCQATVANTLRSVLKIVKEDFYGDIQGRKERVSGNC